MKLLAITRFPLEIRPQRVRRRLANSMAAADSALARLWDVLEDDPAATLVRMSGQDRWSDSLERRVADLHTPFEPWR
jgi:hypothetical protein